MGFCFLFDVSMCMSTCIHVHVYISPCFRISMSPCFHVFMFPCLHVSMSPCFHVSMFPCLHVYVSMTPCLNVSMSPCLHVSMSMSSCPCLHESMSPCHQWFPEFCNLLQTENGKGKLPLVCCKWKHKMEVCFPRSAKDKQ
jgi:hypothetical protein